MEDGDPLKKTRNKTTIKTQQSHFQAYTLRKPKAKKTHVPQSSLQHCLQELEHGSNLDVHRQMNGLRSCGTHTQWNITQP